MSAFLRKSNAAASIAQTPANAQPAPDRAEREQRLRTALMRLGKLNDEAIARIADLQQKTNAPFARAASSLGLVTREDMETAIGVENGFLRERDGEGRLPPGLVIVRRPKSKEAEQFRVLRTRLLTSLDERKIGLMAMASLRRAGACDHVAVNLAASFAQLRKHVLIVDADLRAERLARQFGLKSGPGLRDALAGECDIRSAIRPTIVNNLSVLTSGAIAADSHELLSGEPFQLTIEYLRSAFDIVIVMTAPFGDVADAQFVWARTGSAFAVIRRNEDRFQRLNDLNAALRQSGAEVIGAALAG